MKDPELLSQICGPLRLNYTPNMRGNAHGAGRAKGDIKGFKSAIQSYVDDDLRTHTDKQASALVVLNGKYRERRKTLLGTLLPVDAGGSLRSVMHA